MIVRNMVNLPRLKSREVHGQELTKTNLRWESPLHERWEDVKVLTKQQTTYKIKLSYKKMTSRSNSARVFYKVNKTVSLYMQRDCLFYI